MSDRVREEIKKLKGGKRAGAGRKPGFRHSEDVREKIRASVIVERLHGILEGKYEAQPHQVTAGVALLKKVLPDLSATDLTSKGESIVVEQVKFKS